MHQEPEPTDKDHAAPAGSPYRLFWWRATLLVLLLNSTMFYHGCQQSETYFSIGAAGPFLEVAVKDSDRLPSRVTGGSIGWLFLNLLLVIAGLVCAYRFFPRIANGLVSRTFLAALSVSVAVLNSFLISPEVWSYIAWMPTMHLVEFCEWLVADWTVGQPASGRMAVVLGSRLYFLVSLTGLYLVFKLIVYLTGRYILVDPKRWWQFQLGGLMAVTVLLGTAIGLIVRILRQSG